MVLTFLPSVERVSLARPTAQMASQGNFLVADAISKAAWELEKMTLWPNCTSWLKMEPHPVNLHPKVHH